MKLAIMQPYFFPYIGYFSLMNYADRFIVFDVPQYDRKGWMHRNRVLHPVEGWRYFRAGVVKPKFKASIRDVSLQADGAWKTTILEQLAHYGKCAPCYEDTIAFLSSLFDAQAETLVEFNRLSLTRVRDKSGIDCDIDVFSQMHLELDDVNHSGQWALRICQALGAKEYVNPIGGRDIFDRGEFESAGIRLSFMRHALPEYDQGRAAFVRGLSIVDVMMFNNTEAVHSMLPHYELSRD